MGAAIEQIAGVVLGIAVLLDIFLLVLYARASTSLLSKVISHTAWHAFVWLSRPLGRWQSSFLAFSGPIILIMVLVTWALLLSLATALIIHPHLGTDIRATLGETPTDLLTALYVGGTSLSFIGASDFTPQTGFFRLFYLLTSLIGVYMVTLTITYLMELYTGLRARNAIGLKVHFCPILFYFRFREPYIPCLAQP